MAADRMADDAIAPSAAAGAYEAPSLRQTQKEATRGRVLAAAKLLFDNQGYEGTPLREIARRATNGAPSPQARSGSNDLASSAASVARPRAPRYSAIDSLILRT